MFAVFDKNQDGESLWHVAVESENVNTDFETCVSSAEMYVTANRHALPHQLLPYQHYPHKAFSSLLARLSMKAGRADSHEKGFKLFPSILHECARTSAPDYEQLAVRKRRIGSETSWNLLNIE
jgi:hypothetical protein